MADIQDDRKLEETITRELFTSFSNVRKLMGKVHSNRVLHPAEFMMLGAIHHGGGKCGEDKGEDCAPGVSISELCKRAHSTKSATSKMLKGLEEKDYIKRITDTRDRRVVYITLTETGNEIIQDSTKRIHEFMEKTIQKMGEEEARNLIHTLNRLYDAMQEVTKESDESSTL
ncbi:MarR family winged helix-turn-helix transcriptional regulator [Anaerocolumna xylanovorans]|uniref:DNA-binding transcriptional regulator, MarR family n=1 Tax=Anaerocolumna xylanovorans DSM 12503 TaxID=1121345 RepID=A0A1M7YFW9_9FIRM|nr:MarR family transcriptional regulator [Anaerocolumna xylanovorans]SHO51476.1 DNA-binding transcriptional regulator, MarR family [Anaerocolumna xylanovorans DSM 12503]